MKIKVQIAAFHGTRWTQYAVRFALGGLVTVMTGWIAKQFGPAKAAIDLYFKNSDGTDGLAEAAKAVVALCRDAGAG